MRYDGTRATLLGVFGPRLALEIHDHGGSVEVLDIGSSAGAHGGGDDAIMQAFVAHATTGRPLPTDVDSAIESHLLAFAAEEARLGGRVVDMSELRARVRAE
ncbi:hypothetical protein BH23CHL8_BH23CHL8_01790 [soil metagenome]